MDAIRSWRIAVAVALCCVIALPSSCLGCTFGVNDAANGKCVMYDLSALQSDKGYSVGDQDFPGKFEYIMNVCANVNKSQASAHCADLPDSPIYQTSSEGCHYLGQLSSVLAYPFDPTDPNAGVRVVYYNGENVTEHSDRIDFGNLGIGDEENGYSKPKSGYKGTPEKSRAVIFDFICHQASGHGTPEAVYMWPENVYRVTWRTTYGCPAHTTKTACPAKPFEPTWQSVSFRPSPAWFDNGKFGIMVHWGVFSVPGFKSSWYWKHLLDGEKDFVEFHNRVYGCSGVQPDKYPCTGETFTYEQFTSSFHAEMYNSDEWAQLFKDSGAKYVVLTTKHHEGFCNFPSAEHWNWNSMDVGPHMDLVGNLTDSVKAAGLHMGLYHSLREWYNPLFLQDNENDCKNPRFVEEVLMPTLKSMTLRYKPDVIWADGASGDNNCSHDSVNYWHAPDFLSWLYNESPVKDTVLVNSRWGANGGGDYATGPDRWNPGKKVPNKWESAFTVQKSSYVYDRTVGIESFYSTKDLVYKLAETSSCNGNLLLNVGAAPDGRIIPAFQDRLLGLGDWLKVNGEGLFATMPWTTQSEPNKRVWYSHCKTFAIVYAVAFDWPKKNGTQRQDLVLTQYKYPKTVMVKMLGMDSLNLDFKMMPDGFHIKVPDLDEEDLPSQHAWTFSILYVNTP